MRNLLPYPDYGKDLRAWMALDPDPQRTLKLLQEEVVILMAGIFSLLPYNWFLVSLTPEED